MAKNTPRKQYICTRNTTLENTPYFPNEISDTPIHEKATWNQPPEQYTTIEEIEETDQSMTKNQQGDHIISSKVSIKWKNPTLATNDNKRRQKHTPNPFLNRPRRKRPVKAHFHRNATKNTLS